MVTVTTITNKLKKSIKKYKTSSSAEAGQDRGLVDVSGCAFRPVKKITPYNIALSNIHTTLVVAQKGAWGGAKRAARINGTSVYSHF